MRIVTGHALRDPGLCIELRPCMFVLSFLRSLSFMLNRSKSTDVSGQSVRAMF